MWKHRWKAPVGYLANLLHKPKDYILLNAREPQEPEIGFYVLGCAGNGGTAQKSVAKLMDDCARQGKRKPKFIIILGDNFYDSGVSSENDSVFKTSFYNIYQNNNLTEICGVPCFLIPGNHDHNKHALGKTGANIDFHKIAAQIKHTVLKAKEMFDGHELDLQKLQAFNMPRRYYSCQIPAEEKQQEHALQLFFIDTTRYVKDFLNAKENDFSDTNNQAVWLQNTANRDKEAIKLLFGHHPRKAVDKRSLHSDAEHYLDPEDIKTLRNMGFTGNYNAMLNQIFVYQGLRFDANFFAHTHAMYYFQSAEKDGLCQIGSGGGGGNLQSKKAFGTAKELPCYLYQHGFVAVSVNLKNKDLTFDFHTTNNLHLKFKKGSPVPLRQSQSEDDNVTVLHQAALSAWSSYMAVLHQKQKHQISRWPCFFRQMINSNLGVKRADNIINFFNQYESISLPAALVHLNRCLKRWTPLTSTSFETLFNKALQAHCHMTYTQFAKKHQQATLQKSIASARLRRGGLSSH